MAESRPHEDAMVWMSGDYSARNLHFRRAIVRERLSHVTEITIEFESRGTSASLHEMLGKAMRVHVKTAGEAERIFSGICVSVESLGYHDGFSQYVAEVRPWIWLLTRVRDNRIFQDMTAVDVIRQVFSDHGFSDFDDRLTNSFDTRTYCVQYAESDFDFISRLMEQEGIYYFFENQLDSTAPEKLILCDDIGAHRPVPENDTIEFDPREAGDRRREDMITEWAVDVAAVTGKVTLDDYDFTAPAADLTAVNAQMQDEAIIAGLEKYHYPGRQRIDGLGASEEISRGEWLSRVREEAEHARHVTTRAASGVRTLGTGMTFKLEGYPRDSYNIEYLVTGMVHYVQVLTDLRDHDRETRALSPRNLEFPEQAENQAYTSTLDALPKAFPFRAPQLTPWPKVAGMQTAVVVGPSGEEIYTDEYGRIKVQFHWDRVGGNDENSSCWVRTVMPWTGKNWGMIAIPRIGQEVVIQFEEGDPDRPICTGMLYNADTMPPWELPEHKTRTGIKTNSSKDGGGYNEVMFEDKKGGELLRMQAQMNHQMLVKNKSVVTIGRGAIEAGEHDDEGSLSQTVRNHVTETIQEGDHYFTIETGSQIADINTDQSLSIGNDQIHTIANDQTTTIGNNQDILVSASKTQTIDTGDYKTTVNVGNILVKAGAGKIKIEAAQKIELMVGASSITIDPAQVAIKAPIVKIEGTALTQIKSTLTDIKGDAAVVVKGTFTMIN